MSVSVSVTVSVCVSVICVIYNMFQRSMCDINLPRGKISPEGHRPEGDIDR